MSVWKVMWREIYRDKLALCALILFIVIVATVYIWAAFIDVEAVMAVDIFALARRLQAPCSEFWMGTDDGGRDVLAQFILGARNSFTIAFIVTIGSAIIGILVGLISGFYGGHVDNAIMRILDFIGMIPFLMLVIVFVAITPHHTVVTFAIIMTLFSWQGTARLIRVVTLRQGNMDYVSASKTLGTPNIVIIFREVLPNLISIIVSTMTISLAGNMGVETGLTFLGFGLPFGSPSLGRLVFFAATPANLTGRLWLWLPAALLIIVMMLCINFVGQALNRAADAKKRTV